MGVDVSEGFPVSVGLRQGCVMSPCVRVGVDVSEGFSVSVGLMQGCVMSPWLMFIWLV